MILNTPIVNLVKSLSSFRSKWVGRLSLSLLALAAVPAADACRDCPFPMKVSEGRWLMPNGRVEIILDETIVDESRVELTVRLVEPGKDHILATGQSRVRRGRKNLVVSMKDETGNVIRAQFHFVDGGRDRIKARLTCDSCTIADLIR